MIDEKIKKVLKTCEELSGDCSKCPYSEIDNLSLGRMLLVSIFYTNRLKDKIAELENIINKK